jgi:hypothetical protein
VPCALFMKTALKKKLYFCVTPQMYILLKINENYCHFFLLFEIPCPSFLPALFTPNFSVSQIQSLNKPLY